MMRPSHAAQGVNKLHYRSEGPIKIHQGDNQGQSLGSEAHLEAGFGFFSC